jgi:2-keto-4-pentenoate hydratase/2-oxohepta-3-ene-1,7-dioic acid hydratase in catechol pathway
MRFGTVVQDGHRRTVIGVSDQRVVTLDEVLALPGAPRLEAADGVSGVRALLACSPQTRTDIAALAEVVVDAQSLDNLEFAAPVPDATQVFCLGLNYSAHVDEAGGERPSFPEFFVKLPGSLTGHGQPIILPRASEQIDYEGELVAVIGRRLKDADVDEAELAIGGLTIMNDVSARDLQLRGSQWLPGKILDSFAPCGPFVVTTDELDWRDGLDLRTRLNDQTMQHADTGTMLFSIAEAVAYLSTLVTLHPGDLVATGTPSGVGFTREPPVFLRAGDVVEVEIAGLGTLRNTVAPSA